MTDQKTRWAAQAAKYAVAADKAEAQAQSLYASNDKYRGDVAFFTQPGRIIERERAHARTEKAFRLSQRAEKLRNKAQNLQQLATTNAGDAAARHDAERAAIMSSISIGDTVSCVYGRLEVVKINRKTLGLKGQFGRITIDAHLCRKVFA